MSSNSPSQGNRNDVRGWYRQTDKNGKVIKEVGHRLRGMDFIHTVAGSIVTDSDGNQYEAETYSADGDAYALLKRHMPPELFTKREEGVAEADEYGDEAGQLEPEPTNVIAFPGKPTASSPAAIAAVAPQTWGESFRFVVEAMARLFKGPNGGYINGKGVVCAYGEDPRTGQKLEHKIRFVANDENFVPNMMAEIHDLAAMPGLNTYVFPGLVKLGVRAGERGKKSDVVCRAAIVLDFDSGDDTAMKVAARLPWPAWTMVETSPGNFQCWYILDRAYDPPEVEQASKTLGRALGGDAVHSVDHVFRPSGVPNNPNKTKHDGGRAPAVSRLVTDHCRQEPVSIAQLEAKLAERSSSSAATSSPVSVDLGTFDWDEPGLGEHRPLDADHAEKILGGQWYPEGKRSQGVSLFVDTCREHGYTPRQIVDALTGSKVAERYEGEGRLEQQVATLWIKHKAKGAARAVEIPAKDPQKTARINGKNYLELGDAFLKAHYVSSDGLLRLRRHKGDFYEWTGSHYRIVDAEMLQAQIHKFYTENSAGPTKNRVAEVEYVIRNRTQLAANQDAPFWIDWQGCDPAKLLPCKNGVVNLDTRELLRPSPNLFSRYALDLAYDADAPQPVTWLEFLRSLWGDEEIRCLRQIFGYLVSGALDQEKIFLLIGPRRSGKGTIAKVLRRLLGATNVVGPSLKSLAGDFGAQQLIGKSAALIGDARFEARLDDQSVVVGLLLTTSGRDMQSINRKNRGDPWTGVLPTRFVIMTNKFPRLADASGALVGRLVILKLTQSFYGREDKGLADKLLIELPSILNWALDGLDDLNRTGHFIEPASSEQMVRAFEALASPIGIFIEECCVVGPQERVIRSDLFSAWEAWCIRNNYPAGSSAVFGTDLRTAIHMLRDEHPRGKPGEDRPRYYVGIGLKK